MARTALQEHYGGSLAETLASTYDMRLPTGEGGCRFYVLDPDSGSARLPDARRCGGLGGPMFTVINSSVSKDLDVNDNDGGTLVTLLPTEGASFYLVDKSTTAGEWIVRIYSNVEMSLPISMGRVQLDITFDIASATDTNLRNFWLSRGWDGVTPAALRTTIAANTVLGASVTNFQAFDTGEWPVGTTHLLTIMANATIAGKGGRGGTGGNSTGGNFDIHGQPGGAALVSRVNTSLVSYGFIQGGGGGGGGGGGSTVVGQSVPGGGGGGGAGWIMSQGGSPGTGVNGGNSWFGGSGGLYVPGSGGQGWRNGGAGGGPGQMGLSGDGTLPAGPAGNGGAAGAAIMKKTGTSFIKIRAGTILGAEVTF